MNDADLIQDLFDRGTFPDNFLEVQFAPDFVFEVGVSLLFSLSFRVAIS